MKLLQFLTLFFISGILLSCSADDEKDVKPELVLSIETISFQAVGELKSFHIKSNVNWNISSSENWCTVSPSSGAKGTIQINVEAKVNTQAQERTLDLVVTAGSVSKTIRVVQQGTVILNVSQQSFSLDEQPGSVSFEVESSAPYSVLIDDAWIKQTDQSQEKPVFEIERNTTIFNRSGKIKLTLGSVVKEISILQSSGVLSIPADKTGVERDAMLLSQQMGLGWNLGNSLEATSGPNSNGVYSASETSWGNAKTNKAMIDAVKAAGFNTVRIPCAWSGYIEDVSTHKIKDSWLARVKEVVDYVVDNDMYAIINIHWDGGWLENNPVYSKQVEINAKQEALWKQIAYYFRDYDEHLLFAGTNEVHFDYNTPTTEHVTVQQSFNQTFVDAVRATGGRNAWRNLIVQSYNTNIGYASLYMNMPQDAQGITNRLMAEVHFYDPYDFTLDENSTKYYWGSGFESGNPNKSTWGQEDHVNVEFNKVKTKFLDNNIPVILGEYGVMFRGSLMGAVLENHKIARNYYLNYVTKAAVDRGIIPVYWDSGHTGNGGSGLFNRSTGAQVHADAIEAIVSAQHD